ncbi:MAG: transcriptional repressor NrdR [Bacteriovoracaceae bacterium]|nr:transcriptional repressor NrdR [Bacteriovoracaceae bacterium]
MYCPICNAPETKVIDSRLLQEGDTVRRRRKCESCEKRFTTYESIHIQLPYIVKNDGRRENYKHEKIIKGLKKACHKRGISTDDITNIIKNVEKSLIEKGEKEVSANIVGEIVMENLYKLDPVSYVRFASFYWNYKDIDEFAEGLKNKKISFSVNHGHMPVRMT